MLAAGFLLIILDLRINGFDLLPDVVGAVPCVLALVGLVQHSRWFQLALTGAATMAVVSLEEYLNPPSGYLVHLASALAMTAIVFGTCTAIREISTESRNLRAANTIRWVDLVFSGVLVVIYLLAPKESVELDPSFLVLFIPGFLVTLWIMTWFVILTWRTPVPPTAPTGASA